jgi:hypothetical protein
MDGAPGRWRRGEGVPGLKCLRLTHRDEAAMGWDARALVETWTSVNPTSQSRHVGHPAQGE